MLTVRPEVDSLIARTAVAIVCVALFVPFALAAPPLEAFGRLPGVERMALSPSGSHYAFVAVHGESRRLGIATYGSKLRYQSPISDRKLRDLRWVGDQHVLATFSDTVNLPFTSGRRYELSAVVVVDPEDQTSFSVFEKVKSVANAVFGDHGAALIDGRWHGHFGGITYERSSVSGDHYFADGNPDLYRVDLVTGRARRVARGSSNHGGWALDEGGNVVAHAMYFDKTGLWQLYAGKRRDRLLMERQAPLGGVELLGLGRAPGTVLVIDTTGDEDVLLEISTADGRAVRLLDDESTDDLLFDPVSRQLIGATVPDARGALFFDEPMQDRFNATRKAFPGLQVSLISVSRDLARLLVKTDGGDDSGTYWLVDMGTGNAEPVGYAYPQIRPADVAPTLTYRYVASDGLGIEAVLTLPPGREPKQLPLVVMPHGGPIGVRDRIGFDWWAQAFASNGYAVLQPNYRGSSGYGSAFQRAGYGEWGGKMLSDIASGVAALAADGIIDAQRACIVGSSYGGYAALAGVTLQQGHYRCAVSVNGVADLRTFLGVEHRRHGYHSAVSRFWRAATGAETDAATLREISPIAHVKHADAPVLLIHGKDDTVVPATQSRSMAAALRGEEKPVELSLIDGEDHWLSRQASRMETLETSVKFVLRHNPPDFDRRRSARNLASQN